MKKYLIFSVLFFIVFIGIGFTDVGPTLTWEASTGTVKGYAVYYGPADQEGVPYRQDVGNVTSIPLYSLSQAFNSTWKYVVRAYNDAGESENSNIVEHTRKGFVSTSNPAPAVITIPTPPSKIIIEFSGATE